MKIGPRPMAAFSFVLSVVTVATSVEAQDSPAHTHLAHVATEFSGAPGGRGLAVTAAEEINVVMRHANLAAGNLADLESMRTHAGHVLHALDPAEVPEGPGLDFGVIPADNAVIRHIELAMDAEGGSESLRTHAAHVAQAARAVVARAEELVGIARQVLAAETVAEAAPHAQSLRQVALQLDTGVDLDGNGRLDLDGIEGGQEQLEDHTYLILEGEMLPRILR